MSICLGDQQTFVGKSNMYCIIMLNLKHICIYTYYMHMIFVLLLLDGKLLKVVGCVLVIFFFVQFLGNPFLPHW